MEDIWNHMLKSLGITSEQWRECLARPFQLNMLYCPSMDWLFVAKDKEGPDKGCLDGKYVACPTTSLGVDLLRHPYENRIIGAKYWSVGNMVVQYGLNDLPDPCPATLFADLNDRWFEESPGGKAVLGPERLHEALAAHAQARTIAEGAGDLPEQVRTDIRKAVQHLRDHLLKRPH